MNLPQAHDVPWFRAYTLAERAASRHSIEATTTSDDEQRIADWLKRSRLNDEAGLARKLGNLSLSRGDFAALLREPTESLRDRLGPATWMSELEAAFAADDERTFVIPPAVAARPEIGFLNVVAPLVERAWRKLQAHVGAELRAQPTSLFDASVSASIAADWPAELLEMFMRALIAELHRAKARGELRGDNETERFQSFVDRLADRSFAWAILGRYPVLARQAVTRLQLRVDAGVDLLRRLRADWSELVETFGEPLAQAGRLLAVECGLGDSHRGGRAVAELQFASGYRLLYKPRPMRVELRFQRLLAWINDQGVDAPFRPLRMVARDEYGWAEHVAVEPCRSQAEARRFYRRHGGYLALLYALQGTDIHFGNVIAHGEQPILIDAEALFTPDIAVGDEVARVQWSDVTGSVLRSGLWPARMWSDAENEGVDIGGMGDPGGTPVARGVPLVEHAGTDRMCITRGPKLWESGKNRPFLDGAAVLPEDHAADIEAGFVETYDILLRNRDALLAESGQLAAFAGEEVRVVLQPTSLYSIMSIEGAHPTLTRSALARDCFFDRLFFNADKLPFLTAIEPAARRALEQGDIPVFTAIAGSRSLHTGDEILPDFFPRSGLECARDRMAAFGDADRERQRTLIRHALTASRIKGRHFSMAR
ncbi:MAG: type 2 lantibiotic biosynthesis protein LanM, partial [bacterium]|nr:type 2 lantibiotic biosynthesis protein LanM [bacterium]